MVLYPANLIVRFLETRAALGDTHHAVVALTGTYHNLLRRWSEL
jgi:predicted 2-oxoglutarate/Fe(II)-dependent dioxygenase YbiX